MGEGLGSIYITETESQGEGQRHKFLLIIKKAFLAIRQSENYAGTLEVSEPNPSPQGQS